MGKITLLRLHRAICRLQSRVFSTRSQIARIAQPTVSFTFDDFPENASTIGSEILTAEKIPATYYVSLGLLGKESPTGKIASFKNIEHLITQGHEIGCHTYDHLNAWTTRSDDFENSIRRNASTFSDHFSGMRFHTMSYPIDHPHPKIKKVAQQHFNACRSGGQKSNFRIVDLNALNSFFLEKARGNINLVEKVILTTRRECGWLIFSTHDISHEPTKYGCTPTFLKETIAICKENGFKFRTVADTVNSFRRNEIDN